MSAPGRPARRASGHGFTLVELIVSIALISLLAVAAAPLLRLPLAAWMDVSRRAELTQVAEFAQGQLAADLRRALPNSVRVRSVGSRVLLEYLEVRASGRHRVGSGGGAPVCAAVCAQANARDALEPACPETCFSSLGPLIGDPPAPGSDWVVVNPLGPTLPGGDPYFGGNAAAAGGIKARLLDTAASPQGTRVRLQAHSFPALAASRRFYLVATPVTYDCNPARNELLRHSGYPISAAQPVAFAAATASVPVARWVAACNLRYAAAGAAGQGGVVSMTLRLTLPAAEAGVVEAFEVVAQHAVSEGL